MSNQPSPAEILRRELEQMGNPPLTKWGEWAIAHWKEYEPERYEGLRAAGMLEDAATLAQEQAKMLYGVMIEQGTDPLQAKEIALTTFILTPTYQPEPWEIEAADGAANAEIEKHLKASDNA